jgi:hypothetical protein
MKIFMLATAAGPNFVLQTGKVYDGVPGRVAKPLLAGGQPGHIDSAGRHGWLPSAEIFDPSKHSKKPVLQFGGKPDPEENRAEDIDGEDEVIDGDAA